MLMTLQNTPQNEEKNGVFFNKRIKIENGKNELTHEVVSPNFYQSMREANSKSTSLVSMKILKQSKKIYSEKFKPVIVAITDSKISPSKIQQANRGHLVNTQDNIHRKDKK